MSSKLRIDTERLIGRIEKLGNIGSIEGGGVCRLALSDEDRKGRDLVVDWMKKLNLDITIDQIGNVIALRKGEENVKPVMTGSHIDTVATGGIFDGNLGVLAGLEVIETLNDAGVVTRKPIGVGFFTNEEGSRFAPDMMGSGVHQGALDLNSMLKVKDMGGKSVGEELEKIGYVGKTPTNIFRADSFIELHIEQGPILEKEGVPIGVVMGAQGQRTFQVTVTGEEGHAGTLPMTLRKDAFLGAARMADALNSIAFQYDPNPVITVGHVRVRPNSRNTIAGQTVFTIDSRHPEAAKLQAIKTDMIAACQDIATNMSLELEIIG